MSEFTLIGEALHSVLLLVISCIGMLMIVIGCCCMLSAVATGLDKWTLPESPTINLNKEANQDTVDQPRKAKDQ